MSEIDTVDNAAATTADDDTAASSTEIEQELPLGTEGNEVETPEVKEEEPGIIETEANQKRYNEITRTVRDQAAEIEQLKRRGPIQHDDQGAPNPDDFDDNDDFIRADAEYKATKNVINLINQDRVQEQQEQTARQSQQRIATYNQRVVGVEKDIPDFKATVMGSLLIATDSAGNLSAATEAILELDNGPQVAHHIAKNPELAASLNSSTPIQATMAITRLSEKLSAKPVTINEIPDPIGSEDVGTGTAAAGDGLLNIKGATFE